MHRPKPREQTSGGTAVYAELRAFYEGGPPLDQALYTCRCGYAFEALVSTSVGCPQCGSVQAW